MRRFPTPSFSRPHPMQIDGGRVRAGRGVLALSLSRALSLATKEGSGRLAMGAQTPIAVASESYTYISHPRISGGIDLQNPSPRTKCGRGAMEVR